MANKKKTNIPLLICVLAFAAGMGIGAWGLIKEECIGPNCWVGSGFLKWTGGIMIIGGLIGMFTVRGNGK